MMEQAGQSQVEPGPRRHFNPLPTTASAAKPRLPEQAAWTESSQPCNGNRPARQIALELAPHLPTLRRFARKLTRNAFDAEDLVQDSLERALRSGHQLRTPSALGSWLNMILYNTWISNRRQAARRGDQLTADLDNLVSSRPAEQEQGLLASDVLKAIDRLPAGQRDAMHLVAIGDLSYRDAAVALRVPVGTVMSRLSRARTDLRHSFAT